MNWSNALIWLALLAIILLLSGGRSTRHSPDNWRVAIAFAIFVASLACSPIFSLYLSELWGLKLGTGSLLAFAWAGAFISLPLSLLCARAFGPDTYGTYVAYLERSGRAKMQVIWAIWFGVSAVLLAYGIVRLS
ncbi:hypothetical protein SJA_C1-31560 [Sphingobium indicum UT26S]|uniref:Uncharacterized protein n=1 Tax=Sphingobium indicum (strain DSM 16413 / CCM 7287 / MTCC 6362 / UT26 / NBRC 101211 / UT26S) TaxID=452662 RepID=D4Z5V8_SPHIU|nr:hypothetical protein SJA_C1-31560 [Sphingobium indicum UT26S]